MALSKRFLVPLLALLSLTCLPVPTFAQQGAPGPLKSVQSVVATVETGAPVELAGIVVEVYWDKAFLLRDDTGIVVVRLRTGQQDKLKLQRGDLVALLGRTFNIETLRTVVDAENLQVVRRTTREIPSTRVANIDAMMTNSKDGDIVTLVGQVGDEKGEVLELKDDTSAVHLYLGEGFRYRANILKGSHVVVAGEVGERAGLEKIVRVIGIKEVPDPRGLEIPPEVRGKVKELDKALGDTKAGQEIVTRGRIIKYIGAKVRDVIYDGENALVIDAEDSAGPPLESGDEVIVKGTLDFIEYKGKQVAVVRHAKVMKEMKPGTK